MLIYKRIVIFYIYIKTCLQKIFITFVVIPFSNIAPLKQILDYCSIIWVIGNKLVALSI